MRALLSRSCVLVTRGPRAAWVPAAPGESQVGEAAWLDFGSGTPLPPVRLVRPLLGAWQDSGKPLGSSVPRASPGEALFVNVDIANALDCVPGGRQAP